MSPPSSNPMSHATAIGITCHEGAELSLPALAVIVHAPDMASATAIRDYLSSLATAPVETTADLGVEDDACGDDIDCPTCGQGHTGSAACSLRKRVIASASAPSTRDGLCREGFCSPNKPCVLPAGHRGPHQFTAKAVAVSSSSADHYQRTGSPECWCGHRKASHDPAGCCGICSCVGFAEKTSGEQS